MPQKKSKKKTKKSSANASQNGSQGQNSSLSIDHSENEVNDDSGIQNTGANEESRALNDSTESTDPAVEAAETAQSNPPDEFVAKADQVLDTYANSPFASPTAKVEEASKEKRGSPQAPDLILSPITQAAEVASPRPAEVSETPIPAPSPKSVVAEEVAKTPSPVPSPEIAKADSPVTKAREKAPSSSPSPKAEESEGSEKQLSPTSSYKDAVVPLLVPTPKVSDIPEVLSPAPAELPTPSREITAIRESPVPTVEITELPVHSTEAAPPASVRSVKREDDLLRQSVDLAAMLPPPTPGYPNLPSGRPTPSGSVSIPTVSIEPMVAASPARSVRAASPAAAYPQSPAVQNIPESPAKFSNITSFVNGSIALESAPAEPSQTWPARHAGPALYQSPPRASALDSVALQEGSQVWNSIAESAPKASTYNTSGPMTLAAHSINVRGDSKLIYTPITFEEAMLQVTGSTGKSWRMAQASVGGEKPGGGFARFCKSCLSRSSVKLMIELEQDKEIQNQLFNTPFNPDVDVHRQMLATIYVYFTGDEKPNHPMVGEHWAKIGFQTTHPAAELNSSGGIFTLLCVLYFIDEFGIDAQAIFRESHIFKFATAAIAAAGTAFAVAGKGKLNAKYNSQRQVVAVTCRLFVGLIKQFAASWNQATFSVEEVERIKRALQKTVQSDEGISRVLDEAPAPRAVAASAK